MMNNYKIEWYLELILDMILIIPKYLHLYYFTYSKERLYIDGKTSEYKTIRRDFR